MISKAERERDKALCEKATEGPWEYSDAYNNAGMPTADFIIPGRNDGASIEVLRDDAAFISRTRIALPAYIADAEAMEKRIERVATLLPDLSPINDYGRGRDDALRVALAILRGEV